MPVLIWGLNHNDSHSFDSAHSHQPTINSGGLNDLISENEASDGASPTTPAGLNISHPTH